MKTDRVLLETLIIRINNTSCSITLVIGYRGNLINQMLRVLCMEEF